MINSLLVKAFFLLYNFYKGKTMKDYKYYLDSGIYDFNCGKYSNALENFNQSLSLKNDWDIPYFYRAAANQALDNFDDAILDYTKALSLNDKMIDAYYNRAKIILTRKDIENPDISRAIADLEKAIEEGQDIKSSTQIVEMSSQRMMVKDTDRGRELSAQINDLRKLLEAYRIGLIKERTY